MKKEVDMAPGFHTWATSSSDSEKTQTLESKKLSGDVIRYGDTYNTD